MDARLSMRRHLETDTSHLDEKIADIRSQLEKGKLLFRLFGLH